MHTSSEPFLICLTPSPPCLGSRSQRLLLGDSQSRHRLRCQEVQRQGQAAILQTRASSRLPCRCQPSIHMRSFCQPRTLPRAQPRLSAWPATQPRPRTPAPGAPWPRRLLSSFSLHQTSWRWLSSGPVPQEGVRRGLRAQPRIPHLFCTRQLPAVNLGSCLSGKGAGEGLLLKFFPLGLSIL